ncbi:MAG: DUF222 domain-containing protein [Pseudonocardiaceae bacterium]
MFESTLDAEVPYGGALGDEDWFDPAWLEEVPPFEGAEQIPVSACAPSGWLALELDHATADPAGLSDATLIDTIVGFDRVSSWASARQAGLLAEFARRRPSEDSPPSRSDVPARYSGYAPDEIALALRLSRTTATGRLVMAQTLAADLPGTLAAWQAGTIDVLKARAITETSYVLAPEQRSALEARVLPRAGTQTVAQLRACLAGAVLVIDPDGAAARHEQRRQDRRVVLGPDGDGMATLWALLSAPDATAAYQRLCQLARDLGAEDPAGWTPAAPTCSPTCSPDDAAPPPHPSTPTTARTPRAPRAVTAPPPRPVIRQTPTPRTRPPQTRASMTVRPPAPPAPARASP